MNAAGRRGGEFTSNPNRKESEAGGQEEQISRKSTGRREKDGQADLSAKARLLLSAGLYAEHHPNDTERYRTLPNTLRGLRRTRLLHGFCEQSAGNIKIKAWCLFSSALRRTSHGGRPQLDELLNHPHTHSHSHARRHARGNSTADTDVIGPL